MSAARHRRFRNWDARVHVAERHGLETVTLENRTLRVQVLAGRGADVVECNYKPRDVDFVSLAGEGIRAPGDVAASAPDGVVSFFDVYRGGWQEVVPNGGVPSTHDGASYGQHGEVCLTPWDHAIVADEADHVAVAFETRVGRTPLRLSKTLSLDAATPRLNVSERLVNESRVEQRAMWGQHLAFGPPFLQEGCRIVLPEGARVLPHAKAIDPPQRRVAADREHRWPIATAPDGAAVDLSVVPSRGTPSELLYVTDLAEGRYELLDATDVGIRVEWDVEVLPYLWLWQELGASTGYPWFGEAYTLGLEPFSSYPTNGLAEAVANDSALRLAPGDTRELTWSVTVAEGGRR
jgi:hypothetical protein